MTLLLIVVLLALVWLSGLGATLLLFRRPDETPRLLVCPFLGLVVAVLLSMVLIPLDLNGPSTARVEIALLAALAAFGLWRSPLKREDWRQAWPLLLAGAGALFLCTWPLLAAGYRDYIGYGNPDVAFFITRLRYFSTHEFRMSDPRFYRGLDPGGWVGLLIYVLELSVFTGAAVEDLFAPLCAALVFLAPATVYLLCREGLVLSRPRSLLIGSLAGASSLLAYTFYLCSLGTLTVMILLPAALAMTLRWIREQRLRDAVPPALLLSGALYNYGQGFVVFVAVCGAALAMAILRRSLPWRRVAAGGAVAAAVVGLPSLRYLASTFFVVTGMSSTSRLAAGVDEIQTSFALILTERALPFFWGLNNPYLPVPRWFGSLYPLQLVLYSTSIIFLAITAVSLVLGFSRWPAPFRGALAGAIALILAVHLKSIGYGMFKLVPWTHFLFWTALAAGITSLFGVSRRVVPRAVLVTLLLLYAGLNVGHAIQLGRYSTEREAALLNNTPGMKLSDFRALERMPKNQAALVSLSDPVARAWAGTFAGTPELDDGKVDPIFHPITPLDYRVEDSQPLPFLPNCDDPSRMQLLTDFHIRCAELETKRFLDWKPGRDLVGDNGVGIWFSGYFVLQEKVPADKIVFGRGWYRPERIPGAELAWQRQVFRWWRQRAEFFVIHPSPSPKRVRLGLVSGFGSQDSDRHIGIILNGKQIEEIHLTGYGEYLSRPIVIPGPVSQIELAIAEVVEPMKRQVALWNRWVPADSRRLNVALGQLELVDPSRESAVVPSQIDFVARNGDWGVAADGIFADRWMGRQARVELTVPPAARFLEIKGFAPGGKALSFPFDIELLSGAESLGFAKIKEGGEFSLRLPISKNQAAELGTHASIYIRVPIAFRPVALGISPDTRELSIRIASIGFGASK